MARFEQRAVFAFTRPGDDASQAVARSLGVTWTRVTHMSGLLSFPYALLRGERHIRSEANLAQERLRHGTLQGAAVLVRS